MSSNFRLAVPGQATRLAWFAADGNNALFPQAVVVDSTGTLFATINLSNITVAGVDGGYEGTFTPTDEIEYNVYYTIYSTSGNRDAQSNPLIQGDFETVKAEIFQSYNSSASISGGLDSGDLAAIRKLITKADPKEFWNVILSNGKTAAQELMEKSEFNSKTDQVKTGIQPTDLSVVILELRELQRVVPKILEVKSELQNLKNFITLNDAKADSLLTNMNMLNGFIQETPGKILTFIEKQQTDLRSQGKELGMNNENVVALLQDIKKMIDVSENPKLIANTVNIKVTEALKKIGDIFTSITAMTSDINKIKQKQRTLEIIQ